VSKAIDKAAGQVRATEYEPNYANATFGRGFGGGKHGAVSEPPVTAAAAAWQGWGTALKPALEPITVARKPLGEKTVAANVLEHGTGAINVDGCRIGTETITQRLATVVGGKSIGAKAVGVPQKATGETTQTIGRWPANLIHDGSDETAGLLGEAARFFYCAKASKKDRDEGCEVFEGKYVAQGNQAQAELKRGNVDFDGSNKHNNVQLRKNHHPTVKPTDLMRYLCRLVTQPGGVVLDPFMGSGSTGKAAVLEGFQFIGIEREESYMEIAEARINSAKTPA
jgi:site-specific DNA-methyltransferase (adenine-specific)